MVDMTNPASAPVTRRALAKQKTRERVLDAARRLFSERGYEAATVRDIAQDAGLSTGAVFASFADKAEMFEAVILTDLVDIKSAMETAADQPGDIDEILAGMFGVALSFHAPQLPMLKSALTFSWVRDGETMARVLRAFAPLRDTVTEALRKAVARGQLSQNADIQLISLSLWDLYLSDVRRLALTEAPNTEGLKDRLRRQAEVLLAGYRPAR